MATVPQIVPSVIIFYRTILSSSVALFSRIPSPPMAPPFPSNGAPSHDVSPFFLSVAPPISLLPMDLPPSSTVAFSPFLNPRTTATTSQVLSFCRLIRVHSREKVTPMLCPLFFVSRWNVTATTCSDLVIGMKIKQSSDSSIF
jgi:hypothetical protein